MKISALLLIAQSFAGGDLEVVDLENAPAGTRLEEPTQGFVLDLQVEPLAGQDAGNDEFSVSFQPAPPEADVLLRHGFE
jgi:hypothetical protein